MTRIPFERRDLIKRADGPEYDIPQLCAHPYCDETNVERHHIVRRSEIAGDYAWVEYDGMKIPNLCGLCHEHHQQITENKAAIQWLPGLACFGWVEGGGWHSGGWVVSLSPRLSAETADVAPDIVRDGLPLAPEGGHNGNVCPNCKRPFRKKDEQLEKAKIRRTWAISVPKDELEDGAEVLDTLLEEARKVMADSGMVAYSDEKKARYYILAAVLGLFVQHSQQVMADG